ncbi:MAG: 3-deoxy-7-phosphoheptulonate synthase [Myxococcota bacterium]|nr:3-deoxy-7-phosphoheptulonate synthase [Myxococcota bacterium]
MNEAPMVPPIYDVRLEMFLTLTTDADARRVANTLTQLGLWSRALRDDAGQVTGFWIEPSSQPVAHDTLAALDGIAAVLQSKSTHPLIDRVAQARSIIDVSRPSCTLMAGPCAAESAASVHEIAKWVAACGGRYLRGGAFKPRTSPHAFSGYGRDALQWLRRAADAYGLGVVTEVLSETDVQLVADHADIIQIGSRNMQNYALLRRVGQVEKPVLLKRGIAATVDEWLLAGEHLYKGGASEVIFCERGIRGFDPKTRNLLDLGAVAVLAHQYGLPVVVDPSHAVGRRDLITPLSLAALAAGAKGLLIETNPYPADAQSDGPQALSTDELRRLAEAIGLKSQAARGQDLAS